MVSVCLPSDTLLQHLLSYLGFSYLGCGVSLHSCSSKAQLLLLTSDEGYLLTTALPDLQRGIPPLGPPTPAQPPLLAPQVAPRSSSCSSRPPPLASGATPGRQCVVAPQGYCPWPRTWGSSSPPFLHHGSLAFSAAAPDLGRGVTPLGRA